MESLQKPLTVFFALLFVCAFFVFAKQPQRFLASNADSLSKGYCLAIRGNGEAMPAHWGGVAAALENFGEPMGVAGGSSASITAFLLESISLHPALGEANRAEKMAFLLKSFEGFTRHLASKPEWSSLLELLSTIDNGTSKKNLSLTLQKIFKEKNLEELLRDSQRVSRAIQEVKDSGVFYGPGTKRFVEAWIQYQKEPSAKNQQVLAFSVDQLKKAFEVLGKFDAKNDRDLFVRDGIVDFSALAGLFGKMADFYSLSGSNESINRRSRVWIESCAVNTRGQMWSEIIKKQPKCEKMFQDLIDEYLATTRGEEFRIKDRVGEYLPALITTSVVVGGSISNVEEAKRKYLESFGKDGESTLRISPEDIRFGYWGRDSDLQRVERMIPSSRFIASRIEKSKRYFSLGEVEWKEALRLSPAEPGLSSYQAFESVGGKLLSFGGWSDLHPIPVLKALGCGQVVYLTRRGGDTMFGQGVAKRLFDLDDIRWEDLDSSSKEAIRKNNNGIRENQNGKWSQMYNLANPRSSFSFSLSMADAVICSNWNDFDVKKEFVDLIKDSYRAPIFIRSEVLDSNLIMNPRITKSDNHFDGALGYPAYAGCIYP